MLETTGAMPFNMPMFSSAEWDALTPSLTLTAWQVGSRARTSLMLANGRVFEKAHVLVYGMTSKELLAKFDPVSCSWKTLQLLPGRTGEALPSLRSLPKWVMWDLQGLYSLPMPERLTSAKGGFVWVTPTASDTLNRRPPENFVTTKSGTIRHVNAQGQSSFTRLSQMVRWSTPKASEINETPANWKKRRAIPKNKSMGAALNVQVKMANETLDRLNPAWVGMLMGYPPGWMDIDSCSISFLPPETNHSTNLNLRGQRSVGARRRNRKLKHGEIQ